MDTMYDPKRMAEILDFISEITIGNYHYRLDLKNHKDELEEIALSLNLMVEEIDTAVHQIDHEKSFEVLECANIRLDSKGCIKEVTDNLLLILNYTEKDLINKPLSYVTNNMVFEELIQNPSNSLHEKNELFSGPYRTEFIHQSGFVWVGDIFLNEITSVNKSFYLLSVFKAIQRNNIIAHYLNNRFTSGKAYPTEYRSLLLQDKRKVLLKLHSYVMQNLHTKLPPLKKLAQMIGGSETKLKTMFKNTYGDTIYQYHKRKRLEKSFLLIRDTTIPIGQIAIDCGFISFAHFTRSFKKEFSVVPSKVREN